ncbi:hypothetical protein KJ885_00365 [Patescibacteria group bacterium]|nr:hypothetical protein [Patescibacteria group bacterium]
MDRKIIIKRRPADYHASLQEKPGVWGCGKTQATAIGDMIMSHPAEFGIEIKEEKSLVNRHIVSTLSFPIY